MQPAVWGLQRDFYRHRGQQVFYRAEGVGEEHLLAIHGFPTSSWDWHKVWPGLTARYQVIAPDLLGFGLSDKPVDYAYSLCDQADLCEGLLRERGIGAAHILAHDYGDSVTQELLARQAEGRLGFQIRSVCLLNGGIIPAAHRPRLMQRLLQSPLGRFIGPHMTEASFRRSFLPIFGPNTAPSDEELRGYWYFLQHNHGPRVAHLLIRYMAERRAHASRWVGALRNPGVPLTLIFGAKDPISGQHMIEAFRAINSTATVHELANIGHYPQSEAPEDVLWIFRGGR